MRRIALALVIVIAGTALVASPMAATKLKLAGTTGPGFTISLTQGGKKASSVKAGAATITINDRSSIHNFHLSGPGVNKATSVPKTGSTTWNVTLKKGTYRFVCDPHASVMKGSFTVK